MSFKNKFFVDKEIYREKKKVWVKYLFGIKFCELSLV